MNVLESVSQYKDRISVELNNTLTETELGSAKKKTGKVRDQYDLGGALALITTDRQSAFDRVLASIPFKGQVLNLASAWWFEETKHIIDNHIINVADPNVIVAKKCKVFPIEFVVRGFITGSTSTSLWTVYNNGDREYCGNSLPEGLKKNQKLVKNMLTPTTKEEHHDRPISPAEIVSENWMTQEDWDYCSEKAMELFEFGQKKAKENGMILVDTKYEMGRDENGNILAWSSSGHKGFKGSRKSTPYAAQIAADSAGEKAYDLGLRTLSVQVKGPGSGRETALRALQSRGFKIISIKDTTPLPQNGVRPPKKRRV